MALIYKIVDRDIWRLAEQEGVFRGAAIDLQDGYIHLSDVTQAESTAQRHFAGKTELVLVAFEAEDFGTALKWEAARGGALFPHVYGTLNPAAARWIKELPLQNNVHVFPEGWKL